MSEEANSAPSSPEEQLEAIHAMLRSGHRGIRLERHSFVLWGVTGAILLLAAPRLVTQARFPLVWQRASVELIFLAVVIALAVALDFGVTRRLRRRQDESLPFIQRQIGKVWLLLMGLGLMGTFGMHFHGGGAMVYVFWLLLLGMGLFTHGLFSEQFLGWSGGVVILLAAGALALRVPTDGTYWLAVVVFGAGLPALGFLLRPLEKSAAAVRLGWLVAWVVVVTAGALAAYSVDRARDRPRTAAIPLADFRRQERPVREQVVALPRGTVVPIRVSLRGDAFVQPAAVVVPLELTKELEVVLVDGRLDGRFRVENGEWKHYPNDVSRPLAQLVAHLTRSDGFAVDYATQVATER